MKLILKTFVLPIAIFVLSGTGNVSAHPWGGLVVDGEGNIYFTFIAPFVDEDHYACVWEINRQHSLREVLKSTHSPSDLILARTPGRTIYAAERNNAGAGFQARLWKMEETIREPVVAPTTNESLFYIQAYAVADDGTIFFARNDQLYQRNEKGEVSQVKTNSTFTRIDDLAWGPNGKLYIMDRDSIKILVKGGSVSTLVSGLKEEHPEDLPFAGANILFDFAIDAEGNVYVAYYGNRRVLKVTAEGEVSDFLHASPWSPHGVDVYNGEVYVLESTVGTGPWWKFWENDVIIPRVRKVDAHGKVSTVFEYQREE